LESTPAGHGDNQNVCGQELISLFFDSFSFLHNQLSVVFFKAHHTEDDDPDAQDQEE
jgi:hypothetical protein